MTQNENNEQQVRYQKHYTEMNLDEKMLFNSERTAKNVAVIMWVMVLPLILGAVFSAFYFLIKGLH